MGVPVTGTITTTGSGDTYATTDPLTGIDSWRSVADHTARNAITTLRRRQGMAVWTQNDSKMWILNAAPWAGDDTDWTEFTGGGGATVNSVAMTGDGVVFNATVNGSPITNTGTLIPALLIHNSNLVLAGPVNGNAAAPTFRLLNAADIPSLSYGTGNGTVTQVNTANGVTGGPITGTGTVGLAAIATLTLLANVTNGTTIPSSTTASALLDAAIGSVQGDILYRGASAWSALAPGTNGQVLTTGGASADPSWANAAASGVTQVNTANGIGGGPITGTGTVTLNSTNLNITQHFGTIITPSGTSGTITMDLSVGDWQKPAALTNSCTLAVSNATNGQQFTTILTQGNGNYGVTWFNGITWVGAPYTAPSMPTTNAAILAATFKTTGTNTYLGWWLGNSAT